MQPINSLREALRNENLRAFLHVIRFGESSQDDSAYFTLFGGGGFTSILQHPNTLVTAGGYTSTAAGAYQFIFKTWRSLEQQYGFPDFSPEMQDLGAVALIKGRRALDDVIAGRFEAAIKKCSLEWASLPFSPYGQPRRTLEQCKAVYFQYGGTISEEIPMPAPIIAALLPSLIELIPKLGQLFSSGSEVATRNVAAATVIADAVTKATGAANLQGAIEAIKDDPDKLAAANAAVDQVWLSVTEAGSGGIDGARKAASSQDQPPFWKQAPIWFFLSVLPLVYMLASSVLFGAGGKDWSDDVRMMVATAFVGIISVGAAFFLGSSLGSQKKDALINKG